MAQSSIATTQQNEEPKYYGMTLDEYLEHEQLQDFDELAHIMQNRLDHLRILPTSTVRTLFGPLESNNKKSQEFEDAYIKALSTSEKSWADILTDLDTVDRLMHSMM